MVKNSYKVSLFVVASLFLLFGAMTTLNDSVIPYLQDRMQLSYSRIMLIQMSFFSGYLVAPFLCAMAMRRFGHAMVIRVALLACAFGSILLGYTATLLWYPGILIALYLLGSAIAFLQVSGNAYGILLGPQGSSSSRLTFIHAFNSVGTVFAPLLGAHFILRGGDVKLELPYWTFACVWFVLFLIAMAGKMPVFEEKRQVAHVGREKKRDFVLLLGFFGIFFYVGAEVSIGSFMVKFLQSQAGGGFSTFVAGQMLALYWGGQMIGRFLGGFSMRQFAPDRVLLTHAAVAMSLLMAVFVGQGQVVAFFVLCIGLCNSIMFPTIFSMTMTSLGGNDSRAAGILSVGCIGGAIVPMMQAYIADTASLSLSYAVPFLCYSYIAMLAVMHHRRRVVPARAMA